MSERWREYFDLHGAFDPGWLGTAVNHWGFHETLYGMIARCCPAPARLLDIGSGPGWSDLYLSSLGYEVTGIDSEPSLVELARLQAQRLGVAANFQVADAFDLRDYHGKFDLAFSCGVLEHFDRDVTVQLLREQALCATKVLIQIPTQYTKYAGGITDERIYDIGGLKRIVTDAGLRVESSFGYGDLGATPTHRLLRRILPRVLWRLLQNRGYSYSIAVVGSR
jgi:SAM-dependent methyltransferase